MFFTLLFTMSVAFTVHVVSVVAYTDQDNNEYRAYETAEYQKAVSSLKPERKKIETENVLQPVVQKSIQSIVSHIPKVVSNTIEVEVKPKPKRKPIKVINDDWFMKHYDRICELEAISHRSVLDMYDHEDIFKQFSDLKLLARNLAWEQQQQRARAA